MTSKPQVPAVGYLRASTSLQGCSIETQLLRIADYARQYGFAVLRYYSDEAKSGLTLKNRRALTSLLDIVKSGEADFLAILVYDVSRWGRFQDIDEGAYYEQLCNRAGIRVHYCAESFENDGSAASNLIKSIKRVIAGEFSRELSSRVSAAHIRLSKLGFHQGSSAGYGLRRVVVDSKGKIVERLSAGEHKGIAYRTRLVPGPVEEVKVVKRIYRLYVKELWSVADIARKLNAERVVRDELGHKWTHYMVTKILTCERYIGNYQYNRTTEKLSTPRKWNEASDWTNVENAFPALVSRKLFLRAKRRRQSETRYLSNEELLRKLKSLLLRSGFLSQKLILSDPAMPSSSTYYKRFGGITEAYRRIGYQQTDRRYECIVRARRRMPSG